MKHLSVDIETYSDIDIGKCGLFKYCDSDNFEILLLPTPMTSAMSQSWTSPQDSLSRQRY